jgi:hypothetical protein
MRVFGCHSENVSSIYEHGMVGNYRFDFLLFESVGGSM